MVALGKENPRLCAITAAMPSGTGLTAFQKTFPERTFDVGIAEEHAISMAGGLAKAGMVPVVALYSTFLQRGYDQIIQDIALLGLHVVLAIDRAGVVGDDGPTHHGVFDVGFLRQIPGMTILTPATLEEQRRMLRWAVEEHNGPVAIRYPRGGEGSYDGCDWKGMDGSQVACHRTGKDVTLVTYGTMLDQAMEAARELSDSGVEASVLRLLCVSDLPVKELREKICPGKPVVVVEETAANSGIREALAFALRTEDPSVLVAGRDLGREFVSHGARKELLRDCGLDGVSIGEFVKKVLCQ